MEFEIFKQKNNVQLLFYNEKYYILMPLQIDNEEKFAEYKQFRIIKWKDKKEKTLIEFYDNEYIYEIFDLIAIKIIEGENIFKILDSLNLLFSKDKKNYFELREDIAKILFLINFKKGNINEDKPFDIYLNNKHIITKSFLPETKTINISLKDLNEDVEKYAIPVDFSSDGKTIIDMVEMISNSHKYFLIYIKKRYTKESYSASLKFKITIPINITKELSGELILPNNIISAKFSILLNIKK